MIALKIETSAQRSTVQTRAARATYCLRLTSPLIGFFPPPPTSLRSTGFILRAFFKFLLGLGMLSIHGSTFAPAFFITFAILQSRTVSIKRQIQCNTPGLTSERMGHPQA